MLLRIANINDASKIAENNVMLAFESENISIDYSEVLAGVKTLIQNAEKGFYLAAEKDNEIVGQIMVTYEWSDWHNRQIWWLQSVYVKERWRGQGVFKKLFEKIRDLALKNDVCILRLYVHDKNIRAMASYDHVGMQKMPYSFYQMFLSA